MHLFVLVHGWPGSGKSTVAQALAPELGLALVAKDEVKEALVDVLGRPVTVAESQRLGRAAVAAQLAVARRCPGAVLDSTFKDDVLPAVRALPGRLVEVHCVAPLGVVRSRYRARTDGRHPGHLDDLRDESELWGSPSVPLGFCPVVELDTTRPLDVPALAAAVRAAV